MGRYLDSIKFYFLVDVDFFYNPTLSAPGTRVKIFEWNDGWFDREPPVVHWKGCLFF